MSSERRENTDEAEEMEMKQFLNDGWCPSVMELPTVIQIVQRIERGRKREREKVRDEKFREREREEQVFDLIL